MAQQTATPDDFKFGSLLERKTDGQLIRVLNCSRDGEFDAVFDGVGVEMTIHSQDAEHYTLKEDGSKFKPTKEFMSLVRVYE